MMNSEVSFPSQIPIPTVTFCRNKTVNIYKLKKKKKWLVDYSIYCPITCFHHLKYLGGLFKSIEICHELSNVCQYGCAVTDLAILPFTKLLCFQFFVFTSNVAIHISIHIVWDTFHRISVR